MLRFFKQIELLISDRSHLAIRFFEYYTLDINSFSLTIQIPIRIYITAGRTGPSGVITICALSVLKAPQNNTIYICKLPRFHYNFLKFRYRVGIRAHRNIF